MAQRKWKSQDQITAEDIYKLLQVRYSLPSWALLPQVGNRTGLDIDRWADAVAMSCWPSLGLKFIGFEIKVSRADWLSEICNGEKSQPIFRFCDYWYIVVSDESIVQPGELPPTWGLLAKKGRRLSCAREAPLLQPEEFTKAFVASILRNAVETVTPSARLSAEYRRGIEDGRREEKKSNECRIKSVQENQEFLLKTIAIFEKKTGLKWPYHEYWKSDEEAHTFGEAVRLVMHTDRCLALAEILALKEKIGKIAELIDRAIEESKAVIQVPRTITD